MEGGQSSFDLCRNYTALLIVILHVLLHILFISDAIYKQRMGNQGNRPAVDYQPHITALMPIIAVGRCSHCSRWLQPPQKEKRISHVKKN
jgi:hypothetical protein